jgi:hypothetical protein
MYLIKIQFTATIITIKPKMVTTRNNMTTLMKMGMIITTITIMGVIIIIITITKIIIGKNKNKDMLLFCC